MAEQECDHRFEKSYHYLAIDYLGREIYAETQTCRKCNLVKRDEIIKIPLEDQLENEFMQSGFLIKVNEINKAQIFINLQIFKQLKRIADILEEK